MLGSLVKHLSSLKRRVPYAPISNSNPKENHARGPSLTFDRVDWQKNKLFVPTKTVFPINSRSEKTPPLAEERPTEASKSCVLGPVAISSRPSSSRPGVKEVEVDSMLTDNTALTSGVVKNSTRSSSGEVRIRVPTVFCSLFS